MARGGFATIWEARQESLNRLVAVKIDQRTLDAASERRRFLRESGAAGRMSGHPGIVTVHDAGILGDDRPFLVMELCPGGSLTRWLEPEARPTQRRVREVGVRIADALAAAHSRGVLHRDVKPGNILIDAYDNPGLADFGLAALPEPGDDLSETLEAITPAYAPPEAFQQQPPTEFGDVFSLAATLYAVLGGQPPRWTEGSSPSVRDALARQSRSIERIPGVGPPLMDVLLSAMADAPTDRPTAAQFRDQLAALDVPDTRPGAASPQDPTPAAEPPESLVPAAGAGESPAGESPAGNSPAGRYGRRRPVALIALVVSLLVSAVVAAVALAVALLAPSDPIAVPAPAVTPTTGSPRSSVPNPVSTAVPQGYLDCSAELGAQTFCAGSDECWGGLFTYSDQPALGTPQDCDKSHVYQTFLAGRLTYPVRRQSQLDGDAQVQRVCTSGRANEMLREADRRDDWEVFALPPQTQADGGDDLYRCIFGRGERPGPLPLTKPG